jgi:hypothetical protein
MLPPIDHPCFGYVCGVADGSIPGITSMDCSDLGFSGALAGCVDPRCTQWAPQIPYCWRTIVQQQESQDPDVPKYLPVDPVNFGGGKGCCCGDKGTGLGSGSDIGGAGGSSCCSDDGMSLFGIPWWVWVVIVILVVRYK